MAWKTSEGVCVPWVCPRNSLRGGAAEPMGGTRLDALAACKSAGIVFKSRLLEVLHAGEALAGEVPGASEFQDAHSRNSSEPTTLVFSMLVLTAPLGMLISSFFMATGTDISRGG